VFTTINFAISRNSYFLEILKYLSFAALTASAKAVRMKIHVLRLIEIRDNYTIKIERTYTRQSSQSHVSFVQSPLTRSGWATVKREKKKNFQAKFGGVVKISFVSQISNRRVSVLNPTVAAFRHAVR